MKFKLLRCVFGVIACSTVVTASALFTWAWTEAPQRPPHVGPGGQDMMAEFDTDGDGYLSYQEFPGPGQHFDKMDADKDGFLTSEELLSGRPGPPPGGNGFENDDIDGDDMVSWDEFNGPEDLFDRLDADGDGYITREEADAMRPRHGPMAEE